MCFMIKICLRETLTDTKFRILKDFKGMIKFRNYVHSVNLPLKCWFSEAAVRRWFWKSEFLKISQHSQKNTCAAPCRPSFTEHLGWLLLDFRGSKYCFFSWIWYLLLAVAPAFAPNSFENMSWKLRSSHWNSLKKRVLKIFCKFHRKTIVLKSLFNRPAALLKKDSNTDVFLWNSQNC